MKGARPLSCGEVALAQTVFGNAIDYARVRIVRRKWWFLQTRGVVMAPTGNIHFHPASALWRDDFATASLSLQGLFIHEMTHVWQAQKGGKWFLPLMRHPFCRYRYSLKAGWPLDRYGLEQQAEIMRHIFLGKRDPSAGSPALLAALEERLPFRNA